LGKKVDIIIQNKISSGYSKIIGAHRTNKIILPPPGKMYDLLILVDCAEPHRTFEDIRRISRFIITIDHHYDAKPFGDIYLYERSASTGMIVYKIAKMLVPIDAEIASALYLTIRSDTCSFKNNNTDSKAHEVAGELLFHGANLQLINDIYDSKSLSFLKLMGYTFTNIVYDRQYKIIYLIVKVDQIRKAQSTYEEASMLIDQIRGAEGAEVAFLFLEGYDNIRIKARSKTLNISEVMNQFNGGGHPNAAGAMLYCDDIYSVVESVVCRTREYINQVNQERVRSDGKAVENSFEGKV
jgi:phosphoesterase RecJ-like protein